MNKRFLKIAVIEVLLSLGVVGLIGNNAYAKEKVSVNEFEKLSVNEMYEYFNFSDEQKEQFAK